MSPDAVPHLELCRTCRRPLTSGGVESTCPRCLFEVALLPEEDEPPPSLAAETAAGLRCYGQFEILTDPDGDFQVLGSGAMGTTYRAKDSVLRRPVALKVIRRGYANDASTRARFLREARAAAQLRHPNVASIFHYGEQEGQCYYAMELVEGETLEQRVRRDGALSTAHALGVTVQIARALAAAEVQGIVHRDLKPSNIMLVAGSGEVSAGEEPWSVKVIDFGLAKALVAESSVLGVGDTRGGFVGTPAFASPEQFSRGADERIDTRSDIYSLGVTLWYLLCGKLPFVGRTLTEIHEQQIAQPLPMAQLRTAGVSKLLMELLHSMLAVAPTARPQSARELLQGLARCQRRRWLGGLRVALAKGMIAVGLATIVTLVIAKWRQSVHPTLPLDRSVAVLPLENLGSDPADARFVTGLQDEITADLGLIANLTVSSSSSVKTFKPGKRDLAAIGRELGVTHLLEGTVWHEGAWIKIKLSLVDLRDPIHSWSKEFNRKMADLLAVQSEIARAVADQLQASLSPEEKTAIDRPPTHDLAAYDLYLRSYEGPALFPTVEDLCKDHLRRIALLDQAIARDPNFTRAYCSLAAKHDYLWTHAWALPPEERAVDHRSLAERALQTARRLEPDSGDVHFALANHLSSIRDHEQAGMEADIACRLLPNSAKAQNLAGIIAMEAGQTEKSRRYFERAVVLNPRNPEYRWLLAIAYDYQRRGEESDRVYAELISRVPAEDKPEFIYVRAMSALENRADLAPLRAAMATYNATNDPDGSSRLKAGLILYLYAHDADEASRLLAASSEAKFLDSAYVYPKEWFEVLIAKMRHDPAAAQAACTAARPFFEKEIAEHSANGLYLSYLAMIDAGLGRKEDAVREGLRACELSPYQRDALHAPAVRCNLAVVYLWTEQPDLAITTLAEAAERPAGDGYVSQVTYGDLQLSPIWEPLRGDRRFVELVQKLAPGQKH